MQVADGRRRRRTHSADFKADAVVACTHPGISIAAVAMARGINANLLRRWVKEAELRPGGESPVKTVKSAGAVPAAGASFVPLLLPGEEAAAPEIRIELSRGATVISVRWPAEAGAQCAAWMRELLR